MSSNVAPSRTVAYTFLTIGASLSIFLVALAILYTALIMSIILWTFGIVMGIATVRFGVLPLLTTGTDVVIKVREHQARMRQLHRYTLIDADELGNYQQIFDTQTGRIIYIKPGNPGVPQIAAPRQQQQQWDYEVEAEEVPEQLEAPGIDPATVTAVPMAEEIRQGWLRPGEQPAYGHMIVTDPFTGHTSLEPISTMHEATAFLVGWSGTGKSAFIAGSLARRVVATNGQIALLIIDPHKGNPEKSICAKIRPALDPWIYQPKGGAKVTGLTNEKDLEAVCDFLEAERFLRLERDDLTEEQKRKLSPVGLLPIWVVVDEALAYARQARVKGGNSAYSRFTALMQSIATETAKAGITGIYMSQLGAKKQLGDFEIRDVCPQQIVLRTPADQAETLGLTSAEAKIASKFPQGKGYIIPASGGEPNIFVWGYGSPDDLADAVEGLNSPLDTRKQAGNNVVDLYSRQQHYSDDFYSTMTTELSRKQDGNKFPPALQAELDQIPDYARKLDILEDMIGADRRDIWQALFNRAPGGRKNGEETEQYNILVKAIRYRYKQAMQEA